MRKQIQYARIDSDGFYLEPVLFDEGVIPVDEDIVIVEVQEGLYKPRWDGTAWIEGLTQQEIEELQNQTQKPSSEERIALLEAQNTQLQEENVTNMLALVELHGMILALGGGSE